MKIELKTIEKMAHLARIALSEDEKTKMAGDFEKILDWMEQLNEVDTEGVEPLIHMHTETNVYRKDVADNKLTRAEGLLNAPQKNEAYFMVPKVID